MPVAMTTPSISEKTIAALTHTIQNQTQTHNVSMPQLLTNHTNEAVKVHDQTMKKDTELKSMIENIVSSI